MIPRHLTRKLPGHHGKFSYARIPHPESSGVTYRLFRRDDSGRLHYLAWNFKRDCPIRQAAEDLNIARHQLRDLVDGIDLKLMGVDA